MLRKVSQLTDLVGSTPVVRLNRVVPPDCPTMWVKLEYFNPGGSVKDRMAVAMIEDAERRGILKKDDTLIEPSSGNAGIGLAFAAAVKGYRLIVVTPEIMSKEKMRIIQSLGAKLIVVEVGDWIGMDIAFEKAKELAAEHGYILLNQMENAANAQTHEENTGAEIVEAFSDSGLDFFVAGIGTGGTITGVGRLLRKKFPGIKIYAVEPKDSAVLSGGTPGRHRIEGNGAGFIPPILDRDVYDDVIQVRNEDAFAMCRVLARREGMLAGISSGSAIWASMKISKGQPKSKHLLTISPDRGDRYLHDIYENVEHATTRNVDKIDLHTWTEESFANLV